MKYGFSVPNFGNCGDARVLASLARDLEEAGWDGFFPWDHIRYPGQEPHADPWIALAAIAMSTERIRIGPLVTPVPRRRPHRLAREAATIDQLSGGRLILGVGSGGAPEEFDAFGEATDPKTRGEMLDEGLEIITRLWSGEPVSHAGKHFKAETEAFSPCLQKPRIPIWVAGGWPGGKPFRRAARFDGVVPVHKNWQEPLEPAHVRDLVAYTMDHRDSDEPFDVACYGFSSGKNANEDADRVAAFAEAGLTWWIECRFAWTSTIAQMKKRIRRGPPSL